jgi:ferredoxin
MPKVTIQNEARTVEVPEGANLREALKREKVDLYFGLWAFLNCRGKGLCGKCDVVVLEGRGNLSGMTPKERRRAGTDELTIRLACQAQVNGDVVINTKP